MPGIGRVARLVYLLAALFALTIATTRGVTLWSEWRIALDRAEHSARETARIVEQYARRVFETSDLVADLVSREVAARGGPAALHDDVRLHRLLGEYSERIAGDYLTVFDATGTVVAASVSMPPPRGSFADRAWFSAHQAGADRVVGTALVSRVTGELLFSYSRAVRGADRTLEGIVQVALRPTLFQAAGLTDDPLEGAIRGLWTASGQPLARTGLTAAELGDGRAPAPTQLAVPPGAAGTWRAIGPGDATERLFAWRRLDDWGVVAAVGIPVEAALAPFRRDLAWSLGLLIAMGGALGGLSVIAAAVDRREQTSRAQLAAANARLREGRDILEATVAERTRALAEANDQLRAGEARYRGLFNASFQLVLLLRPDGTLVEANDAALAFAGLEQADISERKLWLTSWWDQSPATAGRLREAVARAAAGEFVRFEAELHGAGGSRMAIDFSLKPARDPDGRLEWLIAEGRDIGALKAAQAQLHEAQKLETLGQLTGGVAHDFNNLLMAILGNLNLLRKRLPEAVGEAAPRLTRLIDGAVQGAERGAALTQRLLAFARRQELRPVAVDLAELTAGMRGLLERSLGAATAILFDVPGGLPPVRVDANQLEMALLNLALNARDAMPAGGTVRIEAREADALGVRPAGLAPGRFVRLAVVDEGTGMDAATLARATEPFFTTKGPGKGSGLGLSMVDGLAAQSGGRLAIRSTPGAGTTVALFLPVAPAAVAVAPPTVTTAAPGPTRPLAVLLVEDDPLIQAGTAAMLEDLGHRVVVAASGAAALEAVRGEEFELVVTDYAMPGMTGVELARRLRLRRAGLPVILATGFAELPAADDAALPRLSKPYGQDALEAAIAAALRDSRPSRAAAAAP